MASALVRRSLASQSLRATCRIQSGCLRAQKVKTMPIARSFSAYAPRMAKKYTEDHEWVELGDDGKTGTIGISVYAAKALGDVVYVELPTIDQEVTKGDTIGAVESVKSASDILSPVSGKIVESNSPLEEKPGTINKSPEGEGWLAKIEISDAAELDGLMDAQGYKAFTEEAEES